MNRPRWTPTLDASPANHSVPGAVRLPVFLVSVATPVTPLPRLARYAIGGGEAPGDSGQRRSPVDRLCRAARLLLLLLTLLTVAPLAPALAQEIASAVATASEVGVYADPAGRFTVPIPTNWTVEEREGYVVFSDPEGDITVSAVVVEGTDAKDGIADAWAIVDPSFDPAAYPGAIEQEVPSAPGVETTLVVTYDLGQVSGDVLQVAAQVSDGRVYVLIFEGTLAAVTRRASQVQIVASGFTITGVAETDLTGVAPQPFRGELVTQFEAYVEDLLARTQ